MKTPKPYFEILIKSHTDAPDFEDSIETNDYKEAVDYFLKGLGPEWDESMIKEYIVRHTYSRDEKTLCSCGAWKPIQYKRCFNCYGKEPAHAK